MLRALKSMNPAGKRALALVAAFQLFSAPLRADDFKEFEIRVIRPKFFQKKKRIELGLQTVVITNQTFIYTYMLSGLATYHLNEQFAVEGAGAFGFSFDKQDKSVLKDNFKIATTILRTKYFAELSLLYTPIYGKYQLSSGRLIYFDTFISAGGGMTGVEYLYDHCKKPEDLGSEAGTTIVTPPAPKTVTYPGAVFGIGQRFFLDKKRSIRWDIKDHIFSYNKADGACDPANAVAASDFHNNLTVQLGMSYFF